MTGSYTEHQKLLKEIQLEIQKTFKDSRTFPLYTGTVQTTFGYLSVGQPGWPDLLCVLLYKSQLVAIAIEIKTGKAVLSKEQKHFKKMWEEIHGLFIVGRTPDQVVTEIKGRYVDV